MRQRARTNAALALPGVLLLGLFFALPVAVIAVDALREGGSAFARVFATAGFWTALGGSSALTLVAATLSTGVGVAVALHLSRLSARRRTVLSFVIALPLTFSGLIVAYGFILGYGRAGFVTQLLAYAGLDPASIGGALFTPVGLAFASSYYLIPRVVIGMLPVLVNFDRAQLAAAATAVDAKASEVIDAIAAATWLQKESGRPLRVPIGVIGPRDATSAQLATALECGELLARCGFVVMCGGRHGVMQAVCEGVARV